jgi:hypothetical protein
VQRPDVKGFLRLRGKRTEKEKGQEPSGSVHVLTVALAVSGME